MRDVDKLHSRVFLSYASADRERALAVTDAHEAAGIEVWIDRRGIAGGSVWIEETTLTRTALPCDGRGAIVLTPRAHFPHN